MKDEEEGGRRTEEGGRREEEGGRRKEEGGGRRGEPVNPCVGGYCYMTSRRKLPAGTHEFSSLLYITVCSLIARKRLPQKTFQVQCCR